MRAPYAPPQRGASSRTCAHAARAACVRAPISPDSVGDGYPCSAALSVASRDSRSSLAVSWVGFEDAALALRGRFHATRLRSDSQASVSARSTVVRGSAKGSPPDSGSHLSRSVEAAAAEGESGFRVSVPAGPVTGIRRSQTPSAIVDGMSLEVSAPQEGSRALTISVACDQITFQRPSRNS